MNDLLPVPSILLSVKPHWAEAIRDGRKKLEVRTRVPRQLLNIGHERRHCVCRERGLPEHWLPAYAYIYATAPVQKVVARCNLHTITLHDGPPDSWCLENSHLSREQWDALSARCCPVDCLWKLYLTRPEPRDVPLATLRQHLSGMPPQGWRYIYWPELCGLEEATT